MTRRALPPASDHSDSSARRSEPADQLMEPANTQPEAAATSKHRKPPKTLAQRLWRGCGHTLLALGSHGFSLLFMLLLVVPVTFFASESVRLWLLATAVRYFSDADGLTLIVESPSSPHPDQWQFAQIRLSKGEDILFSADQLDVNIHLLSLLDKRLNIESLWADAMLLNWANIKALIADSSEDDAGPDFSYEELQQLAGASLVPIRLADIQIEQLKLQGPPLDASTLDPATLIPDSFNPDLFNPKSSNSNSFNPGLDNPPPFAIEGNVEFAWDSSLLEGNVKLTALEAGLARVNLSAQLSRQLVGEIRLALSEQASGWLGQHLQLPPDVALSVHLQTEIRRQDAVWQISLRRMELPWLAHELAANGTVMLDAENQRVSSQNLVLKIGSSAQQLQGWMQGDRYHLSLQLDQFPLAITTPWLPQFSGSLADVSPEAQTGVQEAQAGLQVAQVLLEQAKVSGDFILKGYVDQPQVAGTLSAESGFQDKSLALNTRFSASAQAVNIGILNGQLGELSVSAKGDVNLSAQTMELSAISARVPLDYLDLLGIDSVSDLALDVELRNGRIHGEFEQPLYQGEVKAEGSYRSQPFAANASVSGDINKLLFSPIRLQAEQGELLADGLVNWRDETLDLELELDRMPLRLLSLLDVELPVGLDAMVAAKGSLTGRFLTPVYNGDVSGHGRYKDNSGGITTMALRAALLADAQRVRITDSSAVFDFSGGSLALEAEEDQVREFGETKELGEVGATVKRAEQEQAGQKITTPLDSRAQAYAEVSGDFFPANQEADLRVMFREFPLAAYRLSGTPFPYQANGRLAGELHLKGPIERPQFVTDLSASGRLEQHGFNVNLKAAGDPSSLQLEASDIKWGAATLTAAGTYLEGQADFNLQLAGLDLAGLEVFGLPSIPALAEASISIKGSAQAPDIQGKMKFSRELTVVDTRVPKQMGLQVDLSVGPTLLTLQNTFSLNDQAKGSLQFALPWLEYVQRFQTAEDWMGPDLPLSASLAGQMNLDWLETFINRDIHRLDGELDIDLIASGELTAPYLTGVVRLSDAAYRNQITRTTLKEGQLDLLFEGRRMSIGTGKASDGENGRIIGLGFVDWQAITGTQQRGDVELVVITRDVSLLRRDELEGEASGRLEINGDLDSLLVQGEVEVSPLRIVLNILRDASIPELELVEIEEIAEEDALQTNGAQPLFRLPKVYLDVIMRASRQAYVSGRGLNAELAGQVRLTGELDDADYRGRFAVIRGTFDLFGKRFELEDGDMLFANDAISVFIEGRHSGEEYEYLATISGGLNDLEINLSTVPDLPQDEAVSRLLFGKSVQDITPFQALGLAQAAQQLRGQSSGFDPISTTRDMLQLDNLTIDSESTESGSGVKVGVGKYISERVYVELERSADAVQPWQGSIEVELSPKLSLEGAAEDHGSTSVDLKWKHDY